MKKAGLRDLGIGLCIILLFAGLGAIFKKTPNLSPLKVLRYGPNPVPDEVKKGAIFNVWLTAENVSYSCRILINGKPVKSVAVEQRPGVVTATVDQEFIRSGEPIRLQIIDPLTNRQSDEVLIKN